MKMMVLGVDGRRAAGGLHCVRPACSVRALHTMHQRQRQGASMAPDTARLCAPANTGIPPGVLFDSEPTCQRKSRMLHVSQPDRSTIMKTDAQLQPDVLAELKWKPAVNAFRIGAEVKGGSVTLPGTVHSLAGRNAASYAPLGYYQRSHRFRGRPLTAATEPQAVPALPGAASIRALPNRPAVGKPII